MEQSSRWTALTSKLAIEELVPIFCALSNSLRPPIRPQLFSRLLVFRQAAPSCLWLRCRPSVPDLQNFSSRFPISGTPRKWDAPERCPMI